MLINVEMDLPKAKVKILEKEAKAQGKTVGEIIANIIDFLDAYEDEGLAEVIERMKE